MANHGKVSRKAFFKDFLTLFREWSETSQAHSPFVLLPPGVKSEAHFLNLCNECYDCVAACPHQAVRVCRDSNSVFYGKPIIVPKEQPCYLCPDRPCVTACKPGALQMAFAQELNGVARVNPEQCLAFKGLYCRACVNACPLGQAALFADLTGKPQVNPEMCNGCGVCEHQCPLEEPAIKVQAKS